VGDDNPRVRLGEDDAGGPPPVAPAFRWSRETCGLALRAVPLERHAQHLFTTSQLRLPAAATGEDRDRAWHAVAGSLGVPRDRVLRVRQVHGRQVRVASAADPASCDASALPEGDAIVSNVAGLALAVVVADCVPILLADGRSGAAAAIHAGWRGTCACVARAAIEAMGQAWGTSPSDLVAALGPSIGPGDYEVGVPVVDAFRAAGHGDAIARWFSQADGRLRLDLWRANVDQIVAAGVPPGQVVTCGLSTYAHPAWLESYRRDGPAAGRLVAAIVVPPPRLASRLA
jgi:polyphenol oxidase